ncbi:aspartate aminotransferase family protein [Phragmitibacter flavus]|uniref:Aspartate aminotransferase family protein n=1 Tax=Phragmitibacter flavus TaxID=2576071 RepID=A0A5R8KE28_9BACT|nr:aspartate aminotransferase family protein [Phragmitibacter flavus]TLD70552.1 aspartate aminotransferase family protein [Phragmitibacter flavus]
MGKEFCITPVDVPFVLTRHRSIVTPLPHPDSVPVLEKLRALEPASMRGMPPLVWNCAEDFSVYDDYGNRWIDWSSGVLVTNAGHGMPEIRQAIIDQVRNGLLHNYVFPSEQRATLVELLASVAPEGLDKVFLLTTGSESAEAAIKLSRAHGIKVGGRRKIGIIGFDRGFHGRTLGAQQAGGMDEQKAWIVNTDPAFIQVPFPDGYWQKEVGFETFLDALQEHGLEPADIAGVMMESYQGVGPDFAPVAYVQELAAWCKQHDVILAMDEVQAGFGRTGKFWAFEHYGITPDLICCGKGISSSLPISAVIGRAEVMDQFPPGAMTSTHTGNPVCCAAATASVRRILEHHLTENAASLEPLLVAALEKLQAAHPQHIGRATAKGLVGGLQMVDPVTGQPDHDTAHAIIERSFHKGVLLFAPVGAWGQTIKIAPPLSISRAALVESIDAFSEAVHEILGGESASISSGMMEVAV